VKIAVKVLSGIVIIVVLAVLGLRIFGPGPRNNKPGFWLKGDFVTTPVTDWSFTDQYQTIQLQTHPWYLIPHSVTVTCISYHGQFYLTSNYNGGRQYPMGRRWNKDVARDPHVRMKIGNDLYDGVVSYLVTDPAEQVAVVQAKIKKYPPYGNYIAPNRKPPADTQVILLRVVSSGAT
jgi:hypothetical protein